MYTAMAVVALSWSVAAGDTPSTPTWLDDYQAAQARVGTAGKPMVVVLGNGQDGWREVVRDGGFDSSVNRMLGDKFVPLYVDTTTAKGRQLADSLQVRQ